MIRSLRGRLFIGLTAIIVTAGILDGISTYVWAFDEAIEIQDAALIQIASIAQGARFDPRPRIAEIEEDGQVQLIDLDAAPGDETDFRRLMQLTDGLHTIAWKGQDYRVLAATRSDGSRYAATQPTAVRNKTAAGLAIRSILPVVALIPCLLLVSGIVITRSLRPLILLAGNLDARRADDLQPLPGINAPTEIQPFITSINGLLSRIQTLLDQQRRFIAGAAHELRTPIAALSLQAENLEAVELPETAQRRVALLKQGMQRTKRLLDQLLTLARHEGKPILGEMRPVFLDQSAKEILADLLVQAEDRDIDLGFETVEPTEVRGTSAMLAIIIGNLLANALRHTPRGGEIDVAVYSDGETAVLRVENSGCGIPAADLENIFEPFFRGSHHEGEGSGLGLSIVKRIVESLGGEIVLENMTDGDRSGVRAIVRLPAAASTPGSASMAGIE